MKKFVNFKLACGYRVNAKVKIIKAPNGGTVTIVSAHLPKFEDLLMRIMNERKILFQYEFINSLNYNNEIKGKSFCNPEDEYDEDYGINIATERLQARMNEMVTSRLGQVFDILIKAINNPLFAENVLIESESDKGE